MSSKVIDQCYVTIKGRRIKNPKKQRTRRNEKEHCRRFELA